MSEALLTQAGRLKELLRPSNSTQSGITVPRRTLGARVAIFVLDGLVLSANTLVRFYITPQVHSLKSRSSAVDNLLRV